MFSNKPVISVYLSLDYNVHIQVSNVIIFFRAESFWLVSFYFRRFCSHMEVEGSNILQIPLLFASLNTSSVKHAVLIIFTGWQQRFKYRYRHLLSLYSVIKWANLLRFLKEKLVTKKDAWAKRKFRMMLNIDIDIEIKHSMCRCGN